MLTASLPSDAFVPCQSPISAFSQPAVPPLLAQRAPYVGTRRIPGLDSLETFLCGDERVSIGTTAVPDMLTVTGSTMNMKVPMQFSSIQSLTPVVSPGMSFNGSSIGLRDGVWVVSNGSIGFPSGNAGMYTMGVDNGRFVINHVRGNVTENLAVFYP